MNEKSTVEMAEERAELCRDGAGNYANLCGVLTGFVAVMLVLILTPGFMKDQTTIGFTFSVLLLSVSAFGFLVTAFRFIDMTSAALRDYKSVREMRIEYVRNQVLVLVFTATFLGGITAVTLSLGVFYMAPMTTIGLLWIAFEIFRARWVFTERLPPSDSRHYQLIEEDKERGITSE
jgi:hypothetical protein